MLSGFKSQVDLQRLFLRAEKSSAQTEETKGGHHDLLPIPNGLVPYFQHALATRPGPYLFPDPESGKPRTKNSASKVVERTMKRAGLVEGYDHNWGPRSKLANRKQKMPEPISIP